MDGGRGKALKVDQSRKRVAEKTPDESPNEDERVRYLDHDIDDVDDGDEIESGTEVDTDDELQQMDEPVDYDMQTVRTVGYSRRSQNMGVRARRGWRRPHRPRVGDAQLDTREVSSSTRDARGAGDGGRDGGSRPPRARAAGRFTRAEESSGSKKASDDQSWLVRGPVDGGPIDDSVIPSFLGHVASTMSNPDNINRSILKWQGNNAICTSLISSYNNGTDQMKRMVDETGLGHLPSIMFAHIDRPLISAFVERWQPDTNSFHMPFGEMTITLFDVFLILRIPVDGKMVTEHPNLDRVKALLCDFFECSPDRLNEYYVNGGIPMEKLLSIVNNSEYDDMRAKAWIALALGSTLFMDKSGNKVKPGILEELSLRPDNASGLVGYSWASAALAYMYRQLGIASRGGVTSIGGCLTLLQAWIYEYFPTLRPTRTMRVIAAGDPRTNIWDVGKSTQSDGRLHDFRGILDMMETTDVSWTPYGNVQTDCRKLRVTYTGWIRYRDIIEPYMPDRVVRQIGFVQPIPTPILTPLSAKRPWSGAVYKVNAGNVEGWWLRATGSIDGSTLQRVSFIDPGATTSDYMDWYTRYSHPRLTRQIRVGPTSYPRSNTSHWLYRVGRIAVNGFQELSEERKDHYLQELNAAFQEFSLSS